MKIFENINFSLLRIYIFLFFNCAYAFIIFWIGTTIFLFFPFALGGIIFYLFVTFFHKITIAGIQNGQESIKNPKGQGSVAIFLIILIAFLILYGFGVNLMQKTVVTQFQIPETVFSIVSWSMSIFSLIVSFWLSFSNKNFKPKIVIRKK